MIKVGVLRGGISNQYHQSLKTGERVLKLLDTKKYQPIDIFVDMEGVWHINGRPISPVEIIKKVDIIFNAMHGNIGEDGKVAQFLSAINIPHTSSSALSGAISQNKILAKERAKIYGFKVPEHFLINADIYEDDEIEEVAMYYAKEIYQKISPPWIVKPLWGADSHEVHYAETFHRLVSILTDALLWQTDLLVEEFIIGEELSMASIKNFRKENIYHTFPMKIIHGDKIFFHHIKRDGLYRLVPYQAKKEEIIEKTKNLLSDLNIENYSTIDMINSRKGLYFLEINDLPNLHHEGLFEKLLDSVGVSVDEVVHHSLNQALNRD